jgi:hypothetical protein
LLALDDDLVDRPVVLQRVKGIGVLVELETVRDEAFSARPAAPQCGDRCRERIDLREGPFDSDLAAEYIVRADPYDVLSRPARTILAAD